MITPLPRVGELVSGAQLFKNFISLSAGCCSERSQALSTTYPKAFGSDGVHTRRLPVRSVGSARDWRQHVPRRSPAVGWRTHLAPWPCPMQPNPHPPPTCHSNQSRAVGWLLTIDGARRRVKKGPLSDVLLRSNALGHGPSMNESAEGGAGDGAALGTGRTRSEHEYLQLQPASAHRRSLLYWL